jgi:peptidoglycan/LPS O-acetylase OafA/YrhL
MSNLTYRPDIDGLRAVAILLVVGYHAFPSSMPGGYVGVDVFFVISGYLITSILIKSFESNGFSILNFYQRRILRIFPALIIVLAACFFAGWYISLKEDYAQIGKHIAAGAGFVANLVLWSESGYFDERGETKPLLHLWSLGVEEQFYLIWPLLIWWSISRQHRISRLIVTFLIVSFVANMILVNVDRVAAFFSPISRFWELLIGAYIASLQRHKSETLNYLEKLWIPGFSNIAAWFGLGLVCISAFSFNADIGFPGLYALLPVVGAALLIFAGPSAYFNRILLSASLMIKVGKISYPFYLWHWPLLVFYRKYYEGGSVLGTWVIVLISLILSWITFRWFELPVRYSRRPIRTAQMLAFACAIVGFCGFAVNMLDGVDIRSRVSNDPKVNNLIGNSTWKYSKNKICTDQHHDFSLFCIQSSKRSPAIILLGNSYANHLFPGLIHNDLLNHNSFINLGSCDPSSVLGENRKDCGLQDLLIKSTPSLKYAFISSSWSTFDSSGKRVDSFTEVELPGPDLSNYLMGLRKRLDMLVSHGITPVIFLPKPEIPFHIRACFGSTERELAAILKCTIPRSKLDQQRAVLVSSILNLGNEFPNLKFFDQADIFCDASQCSFIKNGLPLLRDNGHLSTYGSDEMASALILWSRDYLPALLDKNNQ